MSLWIIGLVVLMFGFDLWISILNYDRRKLPLPENVRGIYDETAYQKWMSYTMEKLRLEWIGKSVSTLVMVLLLGFGFFGALEKFSASVSSQPVFQTLIFLGIFMGIHLGIDLPYEWVDTFKIEAKYGFNKTSAKTFWIDQLKNLVLGIALFGLLVWAINDLYLAFRTNLITFAIVAWVLISVFLIFTVLNGKRFVRLFNKLKPVEDLELRDKIHALAIEAGFNVKSISVMDASKRSTKLNGFYSGLGKTGEIVLYDTLLTKMNHDEILAVLAHELGHAKHKDTLRMLILQNQILAYYMIGFTYLLSNSMFFTGFGLTGIHFGFGLVLFSILMEPFSLIFGIFTNTNLRQAEFNADAFAVKLTSKEAMSSVMRILVAENFSNLNPHHLYVLLHYSHPPMSERLKAIQDVVH